jgi:hypothetical protein
MLEYAHAKNSRSQAGREGESVTDLAWLCLISGFFGGALLGWGAGLWVGWQDRRPAASQEKS